MILHEELYFEITFDGAAEELKRFEAFAKSGVFDDFFDVDDDYLIYDDDFSTDSSRRLVFTNDDLGIEIDRFDTEEFLELLCSGAKSLDVSGSLYDIDDEEFRFISPAGDADFTDANNISHFNDELHAEALKEEREEDSAEGTEE